MVNVSKHKLAKEVADKLYTQLADVFFSSDTQLDAMRIINETLTPAERIMLAKRVGIIAMLGEGYSSYEIMHALKVSTLTIARARRKMESGRYRYVANVLRRRKARESIFAVIEEALTALSPARANRTLRTQLTRGMSKVRAGSR